MKTIWRGRAFTLIELLVVIAVIAVLMAILMPALQRAKNQARGIFCQSNTKSLALAWLLYKDDNDDKLVSGHTGDKRWVDNPDNNAGVDPLELKKEAIKRGTLYPYMGENVNAYHCPADERIRIPSQMAFRSYSIAGGMNGVAATGGANIIPHLKYGTIQHPATKYVFLEESDPRGSNKGSWLIDPKNKQWIDPFAIFHSRNRSTLGYADGHAEMHRWLSKGVIDWCEWSTDPARSGSYTFRHDVDSSDPLEVEDFNFMLRGYPYRSLL
jgi:prepilin-type N-terminal cleavage/methylation domain-containing protein